MSVSDQPQDDTAPIKEGSAPDDGASADPAPSEAPRKGRLRRWLVRATLVLIILVLLSPLALSLGPVRDFVAAKASEAIGKPVTIGGAFAFWFHGIDLENVEVGSGEGFDGPLATVASIHADLDVWGLLFGTGKASVTVERPHVMLRRAGDRRNTEGLGGERDASASESEGPAIDVKIVQGAVEAFGFGGDAPARVDGIEVTFSQSADAGLKASLVALGRRMQAGGGDARLSGDVALDGAGQGPVTFQTPALDLVQLGPIVEGFTGVRLEQGSLGAQAQGRLGDAEGMQGKVTLDGQDVVARLPNGTQVRLAKVRGNVDLGGSTEQARAHADVSLQGLSVQGVDGARFEEAHVRLDVEATRRESGWVVPKADLQAGTSIKVVITQPVEIHTGDRMRATGEVRADMDLTRLGNLRALVPALAQVRRGRVALRGRLNDGDGLDISTSALAQDVVMALDDAGGVLREPGLVAQGRYRALADGTHQLDLYGLKGSFLQTQGASPQTPIVLRSGTSGLSVHGPLGMRIILAPLAAAFPEVLGLLPGETLDGVVRVEGGATGEGDRLHMKGTLRVQDLRLPARLATAGGVPDLSAAFEIQRDAGQLRAKVPSIQGGGLQGVADVQMTSGDGGMALASATVDLAVDLAQAMPFLAGPLGIQPGGRVAGLADIDLRVTPASEGGTQLRGKTVVRNLLWHADPAGDPIRQPEITAEHDLLVPEGEGTSQVRMARLVVPGLRADLAGSTWSAVGEDTVVDLKVALDGDASRLTPSMRGLLGAGHEDAQGQGAIRGRLTLRGSTAASGAALLANGDVTLGSWSAHGLQAQAVALRLERPDAGVPQQALLTSTINGGATRITLGVTPGPQMPFRLNVDAQGVDTSSLLVNEGPGRFLAFALPSLLPPDANLPVLSGRLTAQADLTGRDLAMPALEHTLAGTARIFMQEGEIKNSTLFGGGGGGALGNAVGMLVKVVPDVGTEIQRASRALVFQRIDSRLRVGNRQVQVESLQMVGRYLNLTAQGTVGFDQRLALRNRVTFEGSAGERLKKFLPDRTLPMKVGGTLADPSPVPDVDLKSLLGGGLLDGTPVDRIKDKIEDKIKDVLPGLPGLGR